MRFLANISLDIIYLSFDIRLQQYGLSGVRVRVFVDERPTSAHPHHQVVRPHTVPLVLEDDTMLNTLLIISEFMISKIRYYKMFYICAKIDDYA